jgi:hypothetical protein
MEWSENKLKNRSSFLLESDALNSLSVHPKKNQVAVSAGGKIFVLSHNTKFNILIFYFLF